MKYYNFTGKITSNQSILNPNNRAFRYGDSIFEAMYFTNNKIISLKKHWKRLHYGLSILKMNPTKFQSISDFEQQCYELINKNNIEGAARIRLQIWRKNGGLYLPKTNDIEYIIEVSPLENNIYKLSNKGLIIGIALDIYKDVNFFSKIKTNTKQEMILAAMQASENNWDDALILSSKGKIVESSNSNIFILKDNSLLTPPLNDGPLNGIMRQNIIEAANNLFIKVNEKSISPNDLLKANEVFLTNSIKGIQWVETFETKSFTNNLSLKLVNYLNTNML